MNCAPQRAPARRLSRPAGDGRPAAPVRLVHLGLGNFFRAHQAAYTASAPDAAEWGIAAFSGRSAGLARALQEQDGLYTLITRADDGDRFAVLDSVVRAHAAGEHAAWLDYLRRPGVAAVTVTVTEAAYRRRADGGPDLSAPAVRADVDALRADPGAVVRTVPARLVAGLAARRAAGAGPIAIVPCDNLAGNGPTVGRVTVELAAALDPALADWIAESVSFVTTMVDRITPHTTDEDRRRVLAATGRCDPCPVVTEPFSEWVLAGAFPGGRPGWEAAGATIVEDITVFERRKLWLLNGAHSLLAYAGSLRGHTTVAEAMGDRLCRDWVQQWWDVAAAHLDLPATEIAAYRAALTDRFASRAMVHRLDQIAADGSQKIPIRVLPVLRRERAHGRVPAGATRAVAAWIGNLRGHGAAVTDADADRVRALAAGPLPDSVRAVLNYLDPDLAADPAVCSAVLAQTAELAS